MRLWTTRSKEEAHLLNPAFCCTILATTIYEYVNLRKEGMPYALVYMYLPIVLHKHTRDMLPPNIRTSMAAWLQKNSVVRIHFYERLISLKPYTKEALQFGMFADRIIPRENGLLGTTLNNSDVNRSIRKLTDEARLCVMRARFLGKWFATAGASHTIMTFWGIRP